MTRIESFIKFELILAIAIVFFTLIGVASLVSLCFYASFLIMILLAVIMSNYRSQCKTFAIVTICFAFISVIISALFYKGFLTLNNLVFFLVFATLLIYMYILQIVEINRSLFVWIMNWGMVFSACFPIAYYVLGIRTQKGDFISMNFSNSNLLGMWILQAVAFAFINSFWQKGFLKKGISIVLIILNIRLLLLSGTRNALLALVLGGLIVLLYSYKNKKYSKALLVGVSVFPILFMVFYLYTFPFLSKNKFILNFITEGKGIDSRYDVWVATLYNLKGRFFTGSYFSLAGNVHNSHLVVLASYGIIVLILTVIFLYKTMSVANNQCETPFQKLCLVAFFITVFMGIGEGSLFSGAVGLYIPACIYLLLCRYNPEN